MSAAEKKPFLSPLPFSHAGQEPYIFLAVKALCVSWQHKFLEHSPFLSQRAEVRACRPCWQLGACSSPVRGWGFASHAGGFLFPTGPPEVNSCLTAQQPLLHPVPVSFFFLLHSQWRLPTHSMESQSAWDFLVLLLGVHTSPSAFLTSNMRASSVSYKI